MIKINLVSLITIVWRVVEQARNYKTLGRQIQWKELNMYSNSLQNQEFIQQLRNEKKNA
jgi:hypothetical protein